MVEFSGGSRRGRRRETLLAGGLLIVALFLLFLPNSYEQGIRDAVRGTVLRPFLAVQGAIAERRGRRANVPELQAERDSLAALVAAQASLAEENRRLRGMMGLHGRASASFRPAEVIRLGFRGTESTFMLSAGSAEGVQTGSPVVSSGGLIGVVWSVSENSAHAIDWTHPEFRASAMTADGEAYGIVEPRRGAHREEDMLALTGAPFHSDIHPGTRIVTSGRGGLFPRGIPLGVVVGIEEADTGWRKSYLLGPVARPETVTHVLVGIGREQADLSALWHVSAPPDTTLAAPFDSIPAGAPDRPGNPAPRPEGTPVP